MGLSIASCSEDTIKPSSETFSSAANVHGNEQLITQTAEIDEQLKENLGAILGGQSPLFDIETQLVERKVIPDTREINPLDGTQERNVYYGDLHVHTAYSFDGYAFGTLATPYDAYRFAKGEAIKNPAGFDMQLTRPMDFYAVTDHAVFLGLLKAAADKTSAFSKNEFSEPFHDLNAPENFGTDLISRAKRLFSICWFYSECHKRS